MSVRCIKLIYFHLAIKVTIRTSEVIRPVLLHLYASKAQFRAPVIIHANVFESRNPRERSVDALTLIENVQNLLPEAAISLGWTPSEDFTAVNKYPF